MGIKWSPTRSEIIAENETLRADLKALAEAAKPFLGVSALAFRRPAGMDITLYEQRCATALVEALARDGVKEALKDA